MAFDSVRWMVSRYPGRMVAAWLTLAAVVAWISPNLTQLAAEGQARLLPEDSESAQAAELIRETWPDQWYDSVAVAALHRETGLTDADRRFAKTLARRFQVMGNPENVLRVLGPDSPPEIAERLVSKDGTTQLVVIQLSTQFVAPVTQDTVAWLQDQAARLNPPEGLIRWTGDAVIGRDYMRDVQTSLDRAAIATVFLLLGVLLAVYRSFLLAMVPLLTIGVGLVISRGVLGWMAQSGWEISPLVELFLVVILFGCGTDFCLFLSWRFGEHWNSANPAGAMRATLRHSMEPLLTSAGTVIVGLSLMGTTRFKLFSSTGPSVALGLALTLIACLTLTPALLVLLARYRPRAFAGLTRPSSGFWNEIGRTVLTWPVVAWVGTLILMLPLAVLGTQTRFLQDLFSELPPSTPSVETFQMVARKFGPGSVAPLTIVMRSQSDLSDSEGLALIDDLSRVLSRQRRLDEVRSATQPLGRSEPLEPARLASRLQAVNEGFGRMTEGANQLRQGLIEGAAKLRTALQIEKYTGLNLSGSPAANSAKNAEVLVKGLSQASSAMLGLGGTAGASPPSTKPNSVSNEVDPPKDKPEDPRELMLQELTRAAEGAGQIADGAKRARDEISSILKDPVGRRALDRLLITPATVREHPELRRSFAAYLSPDGHLARFDLVQSERLFSTEAMLQVRAIRQRVHDFLGDQDEVPIQGVAVAGANAASADIWAMTRRDQYQTWVVVPLGVFLVLLLTLRDPWPASTSSRRWSSRTCSRSGRRICCS